MLEQNSSMNVCIHGSKTYITVSVLVDNALVAYLNLCILVDRDHLLHDSPVSHLHLPVRWIPKLLDKWHRHIRGTVSKRCVREIESNPQLDLIVAC